MLSVTVNTTPEYPVLISPDGLPAAPETLLARLRRPLAEAVVVSDDTVSSLYLQPLLELLHRGGCRTTPFTFPAGEAAKTPETWLRLIAALSAARLPRDGAVIALGGGVTGDLAGFAAATWLRGVRLIQIPTTLLAAVDSSVGGKTGVDLPGGKNLLGAFHQPELVYCPCACLETLAPAQWLDGLAEMMKYGILHDPLLFAELAGGLDRKRLPELIARCVAIKSAIVAGDERDTGQRQLLNLGHTAGHAIEQCSGYQISHGQAVAIGLAMVAEAGCRRGLTPPECRDQIVAALAALGLPHRSPYPVTTLLPAMLQDKKRGSHAITLVIPRAVGHCELVKLPLTELADFWTGEG